MIGQQKQSQAVSIDGSLSVPQSAEQRVAQMGRCAANRKKPTTAAPEIARIRPPGGTFLSARKGAGWSRTGPAHVPFPKSSIGGPAPIFWPNFLGKNFGNKNRVVSILEQRVLRVVPFCPIARDQRRRENLLDMWTQWHADSRQFDKSAKGEPPR